MWEDLETSPPKKFKTGLMAKDRQQPGLEE